LAACSVWLFWHRSSRERVVRLALGVRGRHRAGGVGRAAIVALAAVTALAIPGRIRVGASEPVRATSGSPALEASGTGDGPGKTARPGSRHRLRGLRRPGWTAWAA